MMLQLVHDVAVYPKEGLMDLLILSLIHAYISLLCISSHFPRFLLILVITSLFACETFALTIVLHIDLRRFRSII